MEKNGSLDPGTYKPVDEVFKFLIVNSTSEIRTSLNQPNCQCNVHLQVVDMTLARPLAMDEAIG